MQSVPSLPLAGTMPEVPPRLTGSRDARPGFAGQVSPAVDKPARPDDELQEVFQSFVGQTFFGQLFSAMRDTVGKPAYMHGGRAEEIFQGQLDQVLSEHMTEASAASIAEPMYQLFQLTRR